MLCRDERDGGRVALSPHVRGRDERCRVEGRMTDRDNSTDGQLVYVVDDDDAIRTLLADFLREEGFRVLEGASGVEVPATVQRESPDLVLMDLRMPDGGGMQALESLKAKELDVPVLMMTAYDTSSAAIQAIQQGAYDYITKPFDLDDILLTIRRALEHSALVRRVREIERPADRETRDKFIGRTPAMQEIFKTIGRVAASDATVMIYGESGTGKELAANALHYNSPRRAGPFVKVNCASFVETLLESELFGHEKGAFTHAISQRKGRFELANRGTIFLDEIGEMTLNTQQKLLRVLQERSFERVGSSVTINTDVRVIAATNRDLTLEIAEGRFRADLYYRLNVITITMPPLRERQDDIPLLVEHFLDKHRITAGGKVARISEEGMAMLTRYTWPGNVRDLENTIERAVVLARGDVITPQHLTFVPTGGAAPHIDVAQRIAAGMSLAKMIEELERAAIEEALRLSGNNHERAAERLGMDYATLVAKMQAYDFPFDEGLRAHFKESSKAPV